MRTGCLHIQFVLLLIRKTRVLPSCNSYFMATLIQDWLQEYLQNFRALLHPYLHSLEKNTNELVLSAIFLSHFSPKHIFDEVVAPFGRDGLRHVRDGDHFSLLLVK